MSPESDTASIVALGRILGSTTATGSPAVNRDMKTYQISRCEHVPPRAVHKLIWFQDALAASLVVFSRLVHTLCGEALRIENTAERGLDWAGLPVLATVARLLCRELTLQNEYLRLENRVLKEKVSGRIRFTDEERRSLMEAALAMGRSLMKEVVSIVKPETILAWQRRLEQKKWDCSERRQRGPGRPRTPEHLAALVCRLARENLWGYQRLRGELLKLRVILSKGCIADILRRNAIPPSPQRQGSTWQQFLSRHAEVMLCADLCTKEVWTLSGLKTAYVLFVLHLGTRRTLLAEATFSPNGLWMGQMARNLLMACEDLEIAPRFVLHDRDKLLIWDFDAVLTGAQTKVVKTPFRAPDANAHAERWVRSVTEECLDHLILFGLGSLQRALRIYRDFFNGHRPHQGIGNRIPERQAIGEPDQPRDLPEQELTVECEQFLGGLLNSYYRKAAWPTPRSSQTQTPAPASRPALSVAGPEPLIVTPTPADEAGWRPSMTYHVVTERFTSSPGYTDGFLDSSVHLFGASSRDSRWWEARTSMPACSRR